MALVKRIALALLLVAGFATAETMDIANFGYLNNNDSTAIIGQAEAQDLLNVDVSPSGHSIKKRDGYGLYKTLSGLSAIHGGYHFYDSTGNDVQVWGSSTSLWGIVSDASAVQLVSSATLASTWDCTDIAAFGYCVNSARNALIKTNGLTITWYSVPTSNIGSMIIATPDRLVTAGSVSNPNTLYFSGSNNYTNFTNGTLATDPFPEIIAAPGSRITHIKYAFGRILWWKDQSFGYVLGTDQTNLQIVTVSNSIGTIDNTDAFFDNVVYWRGQDGQIYEYDGANMMLLSREISGTTSLSQRRKSNSWAQTTQTDFDTGSFTNTTSTIAVNDVTFATNNLGNAANNSFEVGVGTTATGWTHTHSGNAVYFRRIAGAGMNFNGCIKSFTPTDGGWLMQTNDAASNRQHIQIIDATTSNVFADYYQEDTCSDPMATATLSPPTTSYGMLGKVRIQAGNPSNPDYFTNDTAFVIGGPMTFSYTAAAQNGWVLVDFFQKGVSTVTTGSYYSAVHNSPNLTSWDSFNATYTNTVGVSTHTFFVRAATNTFTVRSSTPAWVAQTPGALVAATTGTFLQMRDDFSTDTGTNTIRLNDFTFNWFEGIATDKAYATYFADAVWFAVSVGAAASTNNRILRYDLLNKGWGVYDIPANGFAVQNGFLYFGDPLPTGNIYKFGTGTSDNGAAISAYWKSKDFTGSSVFLENEIQTINVATKTQPNETLTVTYTMNTSTSTSFAIPLTNASDGLIRYKKLIAPGKLGGFFNIKFSDTSTGSQWEVFGVKIDFRPLTYRPS